MSKKRCLVLSAIATLTVIVLLACAFAATPTTVFTAQVQLATSTAAAIQSNDSSIKVGLVTHTDGVNDKAFNQLAWEGLQKSSEEMGLHAKFIESKQHQICHHRLRLCSSQWLDILQ